MTDKISNKNWYIDKFKAFEKRLNGESNSELHQFRKKAIHLFSKLDFPTTKNEEWKYTSLSEVLNYEFTPACLNERSIDTKKLEKILAEYRDKNYLVFVNGFLSKEYSNILLPKTSVSVDSLETVHSSGDEVFSQHFGKYSNFDNGFNALNGAFVEDGAFIHVPNDQVVTEPIYLIYLNGKENVNILSQPRNLFVFGRNSQASFVEVHQPISEFPYLTNALTEIFLDEKAFIDHYKIQKESLSSFHISKIQIEQKTNSKYTSHNISLGGSLTRNDINSVLNGKGCEANYFGLYFVDKKQHVDNHTLVDHAMPHCLSNEYYKGILAEESKGVFNGKIMVRKDAQKTNAYQSNKNLLLSGSARIDTKPQLEIFADDVRCTHGATIGQIDEEALFYLRARGIDEKNARSLLINAFASDILDFIKIEEIKSQLDKVVFEKMKLILSGEQN
ncbi:MAG: Fe-S cluster assembly protein SufD [Ignavibacteria bacterium]|nr:Fe-S cluster assembly protein SufD [Ignavibacteria bacterium]